MNTLQVQHKSDKHSILFGYYSHWTISKHSSGTRTEKLLIFLSFIAQHHQIISEHSSGTTQTRQPVNTPWVKLTLDNQ